MTTYLEQLLKLIREKYGKMPNDKLVNKLFEIGVIDFRLCKVLAIREFVHAAFEAGTTKHDAMWAAAELFNCTYEYARKCFYYYKNINLK